MFSIERDERKKQVRERERSSCVFRGSKRCELLSLETSIDSGTPILVGVEGILRGIHTGVRTEFKILVLSLPRTRSLYTVHGILIIERFAFRLKDSAYESVNILPTVRVPGWRARVYIRPPSRVRHYCKVTVG